MKVQFGGQILMNSSQRPRGMVFVGGFKVSMYRLAADVQQVGEELTGLHSASTGSSTPKGNYRQICGVKPCSRYGVKPEFGVLDTVTYGMRVQLTINAGGIPVNRPGFHVFDVRNVDPPAQVYGYAYVWDEARVFGRAQIAGCARVSGHVQVYGKALVSDNARVSGKARIQDSACVRNSARVTDGALIHGNARVYGNAMVQGDAIVGRYAQVYGDALVQNDALVRGNAEVGGQSIVSDQATVDGNAKLEGKAVVSGSSHIGGTAKLLGGIWQDRDVFEGTWMSPGFPA